ERHIGVNVFEPIDPDIVKPLIETDDDRISYMIIVCVRDGIVDSVQKAMSPAALAVVSQVE
ncbi:MAG: hypothetical protein QF815_01680, partial [Candidatus Peribacteraceae bacterium]|nr:hypothetical protein [Candidatus Peribacteraceae bacterium]